MSTDVLPEKSRIWLPARYREPLTTGSATRPGDIVLDAHAVVSPADVVPRNRVGEGADGTVAKTRGGYGPETLGGRPVTAAVLTPPQPHTPLNDFVRPRRCTGRGTGPRSE
ncbi:hypothetical protein ASD51_13000 [Streptomyces sp. Root55]|nr:hypothetical protein ASD26_26075 [Streptomyces sp. Root1319]KQZ05323.1 hypothetical protein ASD51_13000 [Streptomyces sp. Root55]